MEQQQISAKKLKAMEKVKRANADLAKEVVKDYCERNFVSKGMCVQYAIHDSESMYFGRLNRL